MTQTVSVLRLTPAFDWRVVRGAEGAAFSIGGMGSQVALQVRKAPSIAQHVLTMAVPGAPAEATLGEHVRIRTVGRAAAPGVHRRNARWLAGVIRALPEYRNQVDVVHVHASGLIEPLLACIFARVVLRRPIVLTLHCSALVTYVVQSRRDAFVQLFTRAAERTAIRLSSRTLVLTNRAANALGPRAETMPDWVEADRFAQEPAPAAVKRFRSAHGIPSDRPVGLFVGRVSREKGWPALVGLADRLVDERLHVLVCGDGDELATLVALAASRGVNDAFSFAGAVDQQTIAVAMRCATVLILPSSHEELGSVLIEAMASGLPAVAYDVGGVREAVEEEVTGLLVPAGDEGALAAAVRRVIEDDELRGRMQAAAPHRARTRFDASKWGGHLARLYRDLAVE